MSRRSAERLEDVLAAVEAIRGHTARGDLADGLVFGLAAKVLAQTRGDAAATQWNAGVNAGGCGFSGAAMVDGSTDFRDGRREGPARARASMWIPDCSCFRYTGGSFST